MITRFKIATLKELTETITKAKDYASEVLRTAQDRNKDVKHTLTREGKKITVDEATLWQEVFYLGAKGEATDILKAKYPEVFEAYKKQNEAADNLLKFCVTELGIDYREMRVADYLALTEGMFQMMFEEMKTHLKAEIMQELVDKRMTLATEPEEKK